MDAQQQQTDDRVRYLTGKVKDLETALRDAKAEIRALRIENRTLADQLANRHPNLYSSAAVLEWIQDDILPVPPAATAAAAGGSGEPAPADVGTTPAPSRRSRAGAAHANNEPGDGSSPATPNTATKTLSRNAGGRASPAPNARNTSADPTPRPGSSLGRAHSGGASHPAAVPISAGALAAASSATPTGSVKKAILGKGIHIDAATGLPTNYPVEVGSIKLVSLGEIVFDDGFHNERNIFPLGFTTRRDYQSTSDRDSFTTYTCTITRGTSGGTRGPVFQCTPADNPAGAFTGSSATDVWTQVIKAANQVCGRHASLKISGPELFGLNHPLVIHWIQKLPHAKDLPRYHMQDVVVVDARGRPSVGPTPSTKDPTGGKGAVAVKKEKGTGGGGSGAGADAAAPSGGGDAPGAGADEADKMDVDEPAEQS